LQAGSLLKYKSTHGNSNDIRDCYGLLKYGNGPSFKITDIKSLKAVRKDFKIVVKGIMCQEDAMAALDHGADAIWVSNGSHLKAISAPSTINVLKGIS